MIDLDRVTYITRMTATICETFDALSDAEREGLAAEYNVGLPLARMVEQGHVVPNGVSTFGLRAMIEAAAALDLLFDPFNETTTTPEAAEGRHVVSLNSDTYAALCGILAPCIDSATDADADEIYLQQETWNELGEAFPVEAFRVWNAAQGIGDPACE